MERLVLLGMKKQGFGAGKFNGFGGKLEPGETAEEGAARELFEECGLRADPAHLRCCGMLTYIYDTKPKSMEVIVYDLETWTGEPQETEEMKPVWFGHDDIPLDKMWADDRYWLLQYLDGQLPLPFRGRFRFKGHEGDESGVVLESAVCSLSPALSDCSQPASSTAQLPAPSGSALIVSTVSFLHTQDGFARPLESFLHYHLRKGFSRIFIVVDNVGDEAALTAVRRFPKCSVMVRFRDEALLAEQREKCPSFAELAPLHDTEVSARQMLDAELAMALAPSMGCSWVVCLDSDELFFTKEESVVQHFEALAEADISQMTYLNHEGVPEVEETSDYFATTTLFRQHHFVVPLTSEARSGLRFWMDRTRRKQYLLFYDNGKSACRVGLGARMKSQHVWRLPSGQRSCTALADARNMDVEAYRECHDPCILHFPVCGLAWFRSKYKTLGSFPDSWLGKVKLPACLHSDAREACAEGDDALTALFRCEVLLDDVSEADRQIACGVCMRIEDHAILLDAKRTARQPPASSSKAKGNAAGPLPLPAGEAGNALDDGPLGIERGWILSKSLGYL